jgi:iron-sulfur cluster repair protein YtfE (RIC family)
MDAFQILAKDHRAVEQIFEQIEKSDNRGAKHREQLFHKVRQELKLHTQIEEKVFYPELKRHDGTKKLVGEALLEHGEVEQMLQEIGRLSPEDDQWSEMVNELKLAVQHHVREEEDQMFPAARRELDQSRIDEIGRRIEEMKQNAGA